MKTKKGKVLGSATNCDYARGDEQKTPTWGQLEGKKRKRCDQKEEKKTARREKNTKNVYSSSKRRETRHEGSAGIQGITEKVSLFG